MFAVRTAICLQKQTVGIRGILSQKGYSAIFASKKQFSKYVLLNRDSGNFFIGRKLSNKFNYLVIVLDIMENIEVITEVALLLILMVTVYYLYK